MPILGSFFLLLFIARFPNFIYVIWKVFCFFYALEQLDDPNICVLKSGRDSTSKLCHWPHFPAHLLFMMFGLVTVGF